MLQMKTARGSGLLILRKGVCYVAGGETGSRNMEVLERLIRKAYSNYAHKYGRGERLFVLYVG